MIKQKPEEPVSKGLFSNLFQGDLFKNVETKPLFSFNN